MASDHKKNESESESEMYEMVAEATMVEIRRLEERIKALEKVLVHLQHTNTEDGSRHVNDGGWFD